MDGSSFDRLARLAAFGSSRRNLIKAALIPAAVVAVPALGVEEAGAKKKKCLKSGQFCGRFANGKTKKCCTKQKLACKVALNASNSDTTCCGISGSTCGGSNQDLDDIKPFCCIGFVCSTDDVPNGGPGKCVALDQT